MDYLPCQWEFPTFNIHFGHKNVICQPSFKFILQVVKN